MLQLSLSEWLSHLESIHPKNIELGLARISQVYQRLSFDFSASKVILIGGTNGKGTTCHLLQTILTNHGFTVGCFNSPHILDYRERVTLAGQWFSEQQHCDAFAKVEAARSDIALTYFEMGTLAALVLLTQAQPDYIILEVGLGGRLDSTNIVEPDYSIITTVALDHLDWLGDTREKIGFEKAGIMRANKPAFCFDEQPPESVIAHAKLLDSQLVLAQKDYQWQELQDTWQWQSADTQWTDLPKPCMPIQNAAGVLAVLAQLPITLQKTKINDALQTFKLAGRWQQLSSKPDVIVDVGHNPQASDYLIKQITHYKNQHKNANIYAVVGMLQDKAIEDTLKPFSGLFKQWYLADVAGPRGSKARTLQQALASNDIANEFDNIKQAFRAAKLAATADDLILAFGSFLVVADIYEEIGIDYV